MNKVIPGINDLETCCPNIARLWHPTKNIGLRDGHGRDVSSPNKISYASSQRVYWLDDCGHEYDMRVADKTSGQSCPYCTNHRVLSGFNDLATIRPDLAEEWDYNRNSHLTDIKGRDLSMPDKISPSSNFMVYWLCTKGHSWQDKPNHRHLSNRNCPYCSNQLVLPGYNDLATTNPELAKEWDYVKNANIYDKKGRNLSTPEALTQSSGIDVWWRCKNNHSWKVSPNSRISSKSGCPFCSNKRVSDTNNLLVLFPIVAAEWHPTANVGRTNWLGEDISTPDKVLAHSNYTMTWLCKNGHEWKSSINNRVAGYGCPICSESHGEMEVRKVLEALHINFKEQFIFADRKYHKKGVLKDDFAILHNNKVIGTIEYNGEHHYRVVDFSGHNPKKAQEQFEKVQKRDKVKSDYLKAHNIPQLIIPYWQFNEIEQLVTEFLKELGRIRID